MPVLDKDYRKTGAYKHMPAGLIDSKKYPDDSRKRYVGANGDIKRNVLKKDVVTQYRIDNRPIVCNSTGYTQEQVLAFLLSAPNLDPKIQKRIEQARDTKEVFFEIEHKDGIKYNNTSDNIVFIWNAGHQWTETYKVPLAYRK